MDRRTFLCRALGSTLALTPWARVRGDEMSAEVRAAIDKGLDWLARIQHRDGHWEANGGQYPAAMTALAGMAMLMEGSTLREGKYSNQIRRAVDWFVDRAQPNGLLANTRDPAERNQYIYGHGFGELFLASAYGDDEDERRRKQLEDVLTKAVRFTCDAQTTNGGWYYTSAKDGHNADEGSTTITQMQALRAARNAGIVVPKETLDKTRNYLEKKCTGPDDMVQYRPGQPSITPGLTSAGIACFFSAGDYDAPIVKRWLKAAKGRIGNLGGSGRAGHDEYTHYYWAQCLYVLGEEGWDRLFPGTPESERLTWSKYRKDNFPYLVKSQGSDGSWGSAPGSQWAGIGAVYITSMFLAILQLDRGTLPIYQR
jgi:hypothetical protein